MGTKGEQYAKQFEAKADGATALLEKLTDADWKKVTSAEKWSVGVTAHHAAGALEPIAGFVKTLGEGKPMPHLTAAMLEEMNAKHAVEFASCNKAETLALHRKGVAAASAIVRGLSDADLDRSGSVLAGMPAMSTQQLIENVLIGHVQEHLSSIRATVGA